VGGLARKLARRLAQRIAAIRSSRCRFTVENLQRRRDQAWPPSSFREVFTEATATLKAEFANLNSIVTRFVTFPKCLRPEFSKVNVNEALRGCDPAVRASIHGGGQAAHSARNISSATRCRRIDADSDPAAQRAFQNLVLNRHGWPCLPAARFSLAFPQWRRDRASSRFRIRGKRVLTGRKNAPGCFNALLHHEAVGHRAWGLRSCNSVVSDHHGTIFRFQRRGPRHNPFTLELP